MVVASIDGQAKSAWPMVPLEQVAIFKSGHRNSNTANPNGDHPFFICSSDVLRCDDFDFDEEAVIMAGNNADGVFHLHHYRGKFAVRQRTYVITPRTEILHCTWLFLQLGMLQRFFQVTAIGTTTQYVTIGMLRNAKIALPDLQTQRSITAALSDVDALLGGLDRLIAKKRDLKQAAMQQLLTGQTRLPGFHGEWEVKRLGDVGEISSAGVDKKIRPDEVPVRLVNYLDVYHNDFIYAKDLNHWVTAPTQQAKRCAVQKGDVFFTPTSETRDDIGISAVAMEDIPDAAYSYHVARLRLHEPWDLRFRTYAFKTREFLDQAETLCDGNGTRYVISQGKFRSMTVQVPPLPEQTAIAEVLTDMDAELAALEQRREKTRSLKQAMMQELLTGRTRLV